jgi:hypothetical protein
MAIERGYALPSQSRPYSVEAVDDELERIGAGPVSGPGRLALEAIREEVAPRVLYSEIDSVGSPPALAFDAALIASLELHPRFGYTPEPHDPQSNEVIRYPIDHGWERGVLDRAPLLELPLSMWFYNRAYAHIEVEITEEPATIIRKPNKPTNVIAEPYDTDLHFPDRAFLSFGDAHWSLLLGRDTISWGNGRTGNLLVSGSVDYHDGVTLRAFFDNFTFASTYISLESWLTPAEAALETGDVDPYKAFFAHRYELRFFNRVQIALAESVMYGRRYPELAHLNPLMVFHNWYVAEFANSELTAEVDVTPFPGLNMYGQFVLYQYQSAVEIATWPGADAQPDAYGHLVGVETVHALGKGYAAALGEWVRTNPWLYTVRYASPLISYSTRRRVTAHARYYLDRPMGYRYGPDTDSKTLRLDYLVPGRWGVGLSLEHRLKGEMRFWDFFPDGGGGIPIPEDARERKTPSGPNPERTLVVGLDGRLSGDQLGLPVAGLFDLSAGMSAVWVRNSGNVGGAGRRWVEVWTTLQFTL